MRSMQLLEHTNELLTYGVSTHRKYRLNIVKLNTTHMREYAAQGEKLDLGPT
jgi:hypothetical protein